MDRFRWYHVVLMSEFEANPVFTKRKEWSQTVNSGKKNKDTDEQQHVFQIWFDASDLITQLHQSEASCSMQSLYFWPVEIIYLNDQIKMVLGHQQHHSLFILQVVIRWSCCWILLSTEMKKHCWIVGKMILLFVEMIFLTFKYIRADCSNVLGAKYYNEKVVLCKTFPCCKILVLTDS